MNRDEYNELRAAIESGECVNKLVPLILHFQTYNATDFLERDAISRLEVVLAKLNSNVDMERSRKHALRVMDGLFNRSVN